MEASNPVEVADEDVVSSQECDLSKFCERGESISHGVHVWKCLICEKSFRTKKRRMLSHLSGMSFENSKQSKGITVCQLSVSADSSKKSLLSSARAFCKNIVDEVNQEHRRKIQQESAEKAVKKLKTSQPDITSMLQISKRRAMSSELDQAIGNFIFQNALPFRVVDCPQFKAMLTAAHLSSKDEISIPKREYLRTTILGHAHAVVQQKTEKLPAMHRRRIPN
jgi:hypothetical protein